MLTDGKNWQFYVEILINSLLIYRCLAVVCFLVTVYRGAESAQSSANVVQLSKH